MKNNFERISYCETCDNDQEFDIRNEIITIKLKGDKFSYPAVIPFCKNCGNELSVPEINDLNIIRAYKAQKEHLENKQQEA